MPVHAVLRRLRGRRSGLVGGDEAQRRLFATLPWWPFQPDIGQRLLRGTAGRGLDRAPAAYDVASATGLVYAPTLEPLQFDPRPLGGRPLRLRCLDLENNSSADASPVPLAQPTDVAPPGRNSVGATEWLLLADAAG